jgi:hypothetical protein
MTRGIFIAGNESTLSRAIETEAEKRVEQFAIALIPNRLSETIRISDPENDKQTGNQRIPLEWNPSSPISARALVLAAENRLEHINEAILVCSPPSIRCNPSGLPFSAVEIMANDHIKGWFFLVKELSALFKSRKSGTLALVYPDNNSSSGKDDTADLLGPSSLASFRAFTQSLLAAAYNEPYITTGFSTSDTGNESAFASFVYKSIDDLTKRSNGKLHKFGKFNFFKV